MALIKIFAATLEEYYGLSAKYISYRDFRR